MTQVVTDRFFIRWSLRLCNTSKRNLLRVIVAVVNALVQVWWWWWTIQSLEGRPLIITRPLQIYTFLLMRSQKPIFVLDLTLITNYLLMTTAPFWNQMCLISALIYYLFYRHNLFLLFYISLDIFPRIADINTGSRHDGSSATRALIRLVIGWCLGIIVVFIGVRVRLLLIHKLCLMDWYWLFFVMNEGFYDSIATYLVYFIYWNYWVNSFKICFVFFSSHVSLNDFLLLVDKLFFNSKQ